MRSDLTNRLSVKRGGKFISKTLSKSSSPPSISAPPKAAIGVPKAKKDEVQRRKNSFHDMFKGSTKEKDSVHASLLNTAVTNTNATAPSHGSRGNETTRGATAHLAAESSRYMRQEGVPEEESHRLAELENALAQAREESAKLRQELDRVKQEAQASVEISRYQATEAQRQNPLESAIEVLDSDEGLNDREAELLDQNNELRSRLADLEDQLTAQPTQLSELLHSEEDWDAMALRLHEVEKESSFRLQQLLSLKSSISSLTRADSQVSDSEFVDSFSKLANRVREWVVSNYRRSKMNFDNLPDTTVQLLRTIKATYNEINPADKLAFYQAIVSCILMRVFEEPFVVGMPNQGLFAGLRTFFRDTQHVGAESWVWRRTTLRLIDRSVDASTTHGWTGPALEGLALELEVIMRSISFTELTPSARSALISILNTTADLQRTLCSQKAMYSVVFFGILHEDPSGFDDRTMEPINDFEYVQDDGSELSQQREFNFCVFPCLQKVENDIGNIVFKARVCCGIG